jgi:hypothetical protein
MNLKINNLELDLSMKIMSDLSTIDRFDARWASIEKREGSTLKQLKREYGIQNSGEVLKLLF